MAGKAQVDDVQDIVRVIRVGIERRSLQLRGGLSPSEHGDERPKVYRPAALQREREDVSGLAHFAVTESEILAVA